MTWLNEPDFDAWFGPFEGAELDEKRDHFRTLYGHPLEEHPDTPHTRRRAGVANDNHDRTIEEMR